MIVAGSREELGKLERNGKIAGNILRFAGRIKPLGPTRRGLSVTGKIARGASRNAREEIERREKRSSN